MSAAQTVLIVGGMFNLFFSTLAAFSLYWARLRNPMAPAPHYGVIAHTSSITNGVLLLALVVAIEHTSFTPTINTGLALAEVLATLLSDGRNLLFWYEGIDDGFSQTAEWRRRLRGLTNMINLVVMSAIFYGVTRTVLGF
jgi:hypothetical protein